MAENLYDKAEKNKLQYIIIMQIKYWSLYVIRKYKNYEQNEKININHDSVKMVPNLKTSGK